MNPGTANSPATRTQSSLEWDTAVLAALEKGYTSGEIAKKMAPKNARKQKVIRDRVRRLMARSDTYKRAKLESFNGTVLDNLDETAEALMTRAIRGRPDAIKLALEVSGLHNPRVKHEHSGDIKVSIDMPRPPRQVDQTALDEPIVDADVVEE